MTTHTLPPRYRRAAITVDLVGGGGNGSQMLNGLARLHLAMRALGHPHGLLVRVVDPELVSEANIGRQLFSRADIGLPKASVLVNRVNLFYGLQWQAHCHKYTGLSTNAGLIIGCVDSAEARRSIHTVVRRASDCYWLDLGNEENTGQVVLGRWVRESSIRRQMEGDDAPLEDDEDEEATPEAQTPGTVCRLPLVTELFPHLLDKTRLEASTPSCSLAEALGRQDLFINQGVATLALNLLWRLFREGSIDHHGYFVNLRQGRVAPMPINPGQWQRVKTLKVRRERPPKKGKTRTSAKKRGTRAAKPAKPQPQRRRK